MRGKIKVLLVEDEMVIAQDLRMLLESEGCKVIGIANNGIEALRLARLHSPPIIFMDISIRGEWDGIQTAEVIQSAAKTNIVYLTCCQNPVTLSRAKATKPYKILAKYRRQEVIETLEELKNPL